MYYQPDIETMPVEQLRDLQLERMKKTVQHSYDNVAFYQQSFKEAGVTRATSRPSRTCRSSRSS